MRYRWNPGPARPSCASRERGFTLVEVMIALVVLGTAVVASTEAFARGLRGQSALRAHLETVVLAEARMQALTLLPSDSLRHYETPRDGAFAPPFEDYRWRALVKPDSASPRLLRAAVLVAGPAGEYTLDTALYRADLIPAVTGGYR